ncbi:MAG: M14 family metallopeptidase [Aureisphaera sp.]
MKIEAWYQTYFESKLKGRYIAFHHLDPILESYSEKFNLETVGRSVNGQKIVSLTIGSGSKKVLAWSQMHGNESTTTKALFDFFKFLTQKEYFQDAIQEFLNNYTFKVLPMLNPDGAELYTRENANSIDLNRDAKELSQPESKVLRKVFDAFSPDLCLNLHDQRTLYSLPGGKSATVSFLAPAANPKRSTTKARKMAMDSIARMATMLNRQLPRQIGRYDDTFNDNCVGDTFQSKGIPTILFEAGHFPNDYSRDVTRKYIFYAYLKLFGLYPDDGIELKPLSYRSIPENEKLYRDILLRNVRMDGSDEIQDVAIQYEEQLTEKGILLVPKIDEIGNLSNYLGHKEIDGEGAEILMNIHENVFENEKVSMIVDKYATNRVFFKDSFDVF